MVALAIGMVISLAAAVLYLGVRQTARAAQSISDINQTGKLALEVVGRELEKAGFYPADFPSTASQGGQMGTYINVENPSAVAARKLVFDQGLFGCNGARFDPGSSSCAVPTDETGSVPDSIVINYFATPEFGAAALIGNGNDCNRNPVSNDTANSTRTGLPLFVSNRFALVAQTLAGPDGPVSTHTLSCHGNGNQAGDYQPLLDGIDDMVIGYGVYPSTGSTQSPARFYAADTLKAADWKRVSAVRLCFIVRSIDSSARLQDKAGHARSKPSCRDGMTTPATAPTALAADDHYLYRKFEQVFAVRNNLL